MRDSLHLYYVAHARMPTQKAHGITIAKSCESFALAGATVELIVPRLTKPHQSDLFATYGVARAFRLKELVVPDLLIRTGSRIAFTVQFLLFFVAVFVYFTLKSRRSAIIYTREPLFIYLTFLGYPVVYECHHLFHQSALFFAQVRLAKGVVAISQSLRESLVKNGYPDDRIIVAPSGVDLSVFRIDMSKEEARLKLDLPLHRYIAVYTGNFTTMGQDKGMNDILQALVSLPDVMFVAVGGSQRDREYYGEEAKRRGIADRVLLYGFSSQQELAVYQRAADVLLMPFPNTPHYRSHMSPVKMFEYLTSDRPIIASDLPTIREVLDNNTAFIVRPEAPVELAAAIQHVRRDSEDAMARAHNARVASAIYSWDKRAERILNFCATFRPKPQ